VRRVERRRVQHENRHRRFARVIRGRERFEALDRVSIVVERLDQQL
jgi:hypothetical protein